MKLLKGLLFAIVLVLFAVLLVFAGVFITMPSGNTAATHFDTLIVLGYPSNLDGSPAPEQRERVLEAVREYKAGVAPHIIVSGAAAHNRFIEADTMAQLAESQGVPATSILEEPQAHNTIQNILYSARLMHQHNWSSAEIVSSSSHVPRAAFIANALNAARPDLSINWHTHAARGHLSTASPASCCSTSTRRTTASVSAFTASRQRHSIQSPNDPSPKKAAAEQTHSPPQGRSHTSAATACPRHTP